MTLVESQQRLALERLRIGRWWGCPDPLAELRAAGLDFPAAVISELELNGYAIERVYEVGRLVGVRLVEREDPGRAVTRRHWVVAAALDSARRRPLWLAGGAWYGVRRGPAQSV